MKGDIKLYNLSLTMNNKIEVKTYTIKTHKIQQVMEYNKCVV